MAKDDVRDHLVEVGLQTFRAGGYNHTGVKDLVAAADVPKGSFYYYFDSKEDFAWFRWGLLRWRVLAERSSEKTIAST